MSRCSSNGGDTGGDGTRSDQTSEECMVLMTENRPRHLPVMDGGRLLGIISIGDLVKDIIAEQRFTIEQLEHYISGERG